jgi:hypothetical protein
MPVLTAILNPLLPAGLSLSFIESLGLPITLPVSAMTIIYSVLARKFFASVAHALSAEQSLAHSCWAGFGFIIRRS